MKRLFVSFALLSVLLLASCAGYIDKSIPWRDASGTLHDKYTCWIDHTSGYHYIKVGKSTIPIPYSYSYRECEYE